MIDIGKLAVLGRIEPYTIKSLGSTNGAQHFVLAIGPNGNYEMGLFEALTNRLEGFDGQNVRGKMSPSPYDSLTLVQWRVKSAVPAPIHWAAYMSDAWVAGQVTQAADGLSNAALTAKIAVYTGAVRDLLDCGVITSRTLVSSLTELLGRWKDQRNPTITQAIAAFVDAHPQGFDSTTDTYLQQLLQVSVVAAITDAS